MGVVSDLKILKKEELDKGNWLGEVYVQIDKLISILESGSRVVISNEDYYIYKDGDPYRGVIGKEYELGADSLSSDLDSFLEEWIVPVGDGYCVDIWLL